MNVIERLLGQLKAALRAELAAPEQTRARALAMGDVYAQVDQAVWELPEFAEGWPWINDLYMDDEQLMAIVSAGGRLYRVPVMVDGATATVGTPQEVEMEFVPVGRARGDSGGRFHVLRQADGSYRWFAIAETAVLLRVGEIDSRALFDSFVENAAEVGYPTLRFYHQPGLDFGHADWVARDGNCLLASGLLDEEHPLAQAYIEAAEQGRGVWGTSVGYDPLEEPEQLRLADGVTIPVYTAGVCREISVLPEERAASWFTSIGVEVRRMRADVKEALVTLFGDEDKAEAFIETVDTTNREIEERGLITRETDEPTDETTEDQTEEPETEEPETEEPETEEPEDAGETDAQDIEIDEETMRAIAKMVPAPDPDLAPLTQRLDDLGARLAQQLDDVTRRLEALERAEDDKRRDWQADLPARRAITVTHRPREVQKDGEPSMADRAAATLADLP